MLGLDAGALLFTFAGGVVCEVFFLTSLYWVEDGWTMSEEVDYMEGGVGRGRGRERRVSGQRAGKYKARLGERTRRALLQQQL